MKKSILIIVAFWLGSNLLLHGQTAEDTLAVNHLEEIVISDTKFKIKRENSGKVIHTITSEELSRLKGISIAQILNSVAGIEINGARSNDGQNLNYYIRGGRNRQVLVIIDGVQMTDPSQIANDYDLRLLQSEQIERIEILKGASSILYGSGAATAVINITTKTASKTPFSVNYSTVVGSNQTQDDRDYKIQTFRNTALISGSVSNFDYKFSLGNHYSDGISAISAGTEGDFYNSINTEVQIGYHFNKKSKLSTHFRTNRFKTEFDDSFNFTDAENLSTSRQNSVGLNYNIDYLNGDFNLNAAYNTIKRDIDSSFPTEFNGKTFVVDAFNKYIFNSKYHTVLGVNLIQNDMESFSIPFQGTQFQQDINPEKAKFTIVDPYANLFYTFNGINLNTGIRLNNHSEYGSHLVYSINPSYNLDLNNGNVKVFGSYSTAYITPSLYQLFEPTFGNPDLQPEENATLEFGSSLSTKNGLTMSVVYFNRNEKNFIDFKDLGEFVFQYRNTEDQFTASGLEISVAKMFFDKINVVANATYTRVEEDLNLRIPEIKVNASLTYTPIKRFTTRLDYHYNDQRRDGFFNLDTFTNESITLDSYNLFDLYLSYGLMQGKVNIFANLQNVFNEDYTELFGYSTKGRNLSIGLNIDL